MTVSRKVAAFIIYRTVNAGSTVTSSLTIIRRAQMSQSQIMFMVKYHSELTNNELGTFLHHVSGMAVPSCIATYCCHHAHNRRHAGQQNFKGERTMHSASVIFFSQSHGFLIHSS